MVSELFGGEVALQGLLDAGSDSLIVRFLVKFEGQHVFQGLDQLLYSNFLVNR
jgi:hypothetical protein